jgi:hypothetical protein
MRIVIDTKTNCRKPLLGFFEHMLGAIHKGVSGGSYSSEGQPVAEWRIEPETELRRRPHEARGSAASNACFGA